MKRPELLVCLPAAPFPARRNGIAIRYAPILQYLSKEANVDVIQIASRWAPAMAPGADAGTIRRFTVIERVKTERSLLSRASARARSAVFPFPPHARLATDARQIVEKLRYELHGKSWDTILWVTTGFAEDALPILRKHAARVVIDAIDSTYSHERKEAGRRPLALWDAHWLARWEVRIVQKYDCALYISLSDISELEGFQRGFSARVLHLPNGITADDYVADIAEIPAFAPDDFVIGYLGHMAYPPNIAAALRLKGILDRMANVIPNARLLIIGRSPGKAIQKIGEDPRVTVTGTVESIWPYVNRTDVFVFPMSRGAGQQNKVMEAMYAQKPVITTPVGNRGIGATHEREIFIGETDDAVIGHLKALAASADLRARLGQAGRAFIEESYSWERILPQFQAALFPTLSPNLEY